MILYDLDIEVDYTHQTSTGELNYWIQHLEDIEKELKRFYSKKKYAKHALIKKAVVLKTKSNNSILEALQNYKEFREYWMGCDGLQGGMAFIHEHKKHKKNYILHIKEYRIFKSKLTK
ncbi:hypothetical protein [Formosa sp. PL04]|uniref:hypothetical protein n=1 Tax=Formosa sp. PL04 TaxID=3081755 RepID=UPI002981EB38|nr:hypothetical protein [Formosa sp. PL04]MDW5288492.1 hypothetical protein [Formosa sp. PL04]